MNGSTALAVQHERIAERLLVLTWVLLVNGLAWFISGVAITTGSSHPGTGVQWVLVFLGFWSLVMAAPAYAHYVVNRDSAAALYQAARRPQHSWPYIRRAELEIHGHVFRHAGAPCTCKGKNWQAQMKCLACSPWQA